MKKFWIRAVSMAVIIAAFLGYNMILSLREKEEEIAALNSQLEYAMIAAGESAEAAETDVDRVGSSGETSSTIGELSDADEVGNFGQTSYRDGSYFGEAEGFGGTISLKVTIEGGAMTNVEILEAKNEDGAYFSMAEGIISAMLEAQSAEVDTISGATFSSTGIKNAVEKALEQAVAKDE